jgi:hypothetical protein
MSILKKLILAAVLLTQAQVMLGQSAPIATTVKTDEKKWYDKMRFSGYAQFRYNRLLESNPDLKCEQCDKSWGENNSFAFRRARLVYQGQVHPRVFAYIQFDYAGSIKSKTDKTENIHYLQVRDAYFDLGLDDKNEFRIRIGQSKVPYGFENMQSSSNRLPFDRSDALNSAVPNERDFGAFFMWAPEKIRKLQRDTLAANGNKGMGDYGVFTIGVYNGQTANKPELNNQLHAVAKLSYPFRIASQIIEPGVMAYSGRFVLSPDNITSGVGTSQDSEYDDERLAVGLMIQPKPLGVLAEYTIGKGPEYNSTLDSITTQNLKGEFVTLSYRKVINEQVFQPYVRIQSYDGGKKMEKDARSYQVKEWETGIEWIPVKNFEFTLAYLQSHRQYSDKSTSNYNEKGHLLRIQCQFNY